MQKIDKIVLKETGFMTAWVLIFSAVMQAIFLVIGKWDLKVLYGNLLGGAAVIGNFFAMALMVQKAVSQDEKGAKQTLRASNAVRMLGMFAVLAVGVLLPVFSTWTVIIPFIFPRLIVAFRPLFDRAQRKKEGTNERHES